MVTLDLVDEDDNAEGIQDNKFTPKISRSRRLMDNELLLLNKVCFPKEPGPKKCILSKIEIMYILNICICGLWFMACYEYGLNVTILLNVDIPM